MQKNRQISKKQVAGWAGAVLWLAAWVGSSAPLAPDFSLNDSKALSRKVFETSRTFNHKRNSWRAQVIAPAGAVPKKPDNLVQGFRWTAELPDDVRDAALCLDRLPGYALYINGAMIAQDWREANGVQYLKKHADISRYFRKGKNVVAVESKTFERYGPYTQLLLEGIIHCADGRMIRIATDSQWKAMYAPPEGWTNADFDDSKWSSVKAQGKPAAGYFENTCYYLNPPYYGAIELIPAVNGRYFMYDEGKPVTIPVLISANAVTGAYAIAWRLLDANTEQVLLQGNLGRDCRLDKRFKGEVKAEGLKPGVYDLIVEISVGGTVLDSRVEEVSVIGKIAQREVAGTNLTDGLDLELTDTIDCADANSPYRIFSQTYDGKPISSRIVESKAGRYREAGQAYADWFGFGVKLEHLGEPHLVEVEIPDDKPRIISIKTLECSGVTCIRNCGSGARGWGLVAPGIYTGYDRPVGHTMKKLTYVFFPKVPVTGFILMSQCTAPVAAGKIKIYRIRNGLPAAPVASPDYRLTGQHLERSNPLAQTFYTGPDTWKFIVNFYLTAHRGYYKNWYATAENMIKYLRFTGENMVIAGIFMYYPSNEYNEFWANKDQANFYELLARMLEANGMKMMLGVEYASDENNLVYSMSKEGKPCQNWSGTTDSMVPSVQTGMLNFVHDMAKLFGKTPGIAGIAFQAGASFAPAVSYTVSSTKDPLDWGYGDEVIAMFEKESGRKIPVDAVASNRFKARYDWLTGTPERREQWIEWRNRQVLALNKQIAATMRKGNPAWKMCLYAFPTYLLFSPEVKLEAARAAMRRESFDPALYADDAAVLFGTAWTRSIRMFSATARMWSEDPEVIRLTDEGASSVYDCFYEMSFSPKDFPTGGGLVCDFVMPAEREFLYAFSDILRYATPKIMEQTWNDGQVFSGFEQERREFNRAFRVLPPGPYTTLAGNGLDANVVVRLGPKGKKETAFYVINPGAWPVEVMLDCQPAQSTQVKDLVTGETLVGEEIKINRSEKQISSIQYPISMQPYEMRSLAIAGKGTVAGARVRAAKESEAALKQAALAKLRLYENIEKIGTNRMAQAIAELKIRRTLDEVMSDARKILAAGKAGDYLTIANLTQPMAANVLETYLDAMTTYLEHFAELKDCYRVDCGAAANWTDSAGNQWLADRDWLAGAGDWGCVRGNAAHRGGIKIEGAAPGLEAVYQTERFALDRYSFRVKKGTYTVRLHFVECWCSAPGERVFDITVNRKKMLTAFDIFKEAGGKNKALVKELTVEAPDELLEIGFITNKDAPKIDGIEIEKAAGK